MWQHLKVEYFEWLVKMVDGYNYIELMRVLDSREFYWPDDIPRDENRAMDGEALRIQYIEETMYEDVNVFDRPASVLEVLIALSERMNDVGSPLDDYDRTERWFRLLLHNLGLSKYTDEYGFNSTAYLDIEGRIDTFLDRTYQKNGRGGLFPLKETYEDQRNIEIWYQMSAYFTENE